MIRTDLVNREPDIPNEDLTDLLIKLRNLITRLPKKGTMIRLSTREGVYVGCIQAINIAERRVVLSIEDGTTVIAPFHALLMPDNPKSD